MKSLFYVFIMLFIFTILSSCAVEDSQVKGEIIEQGGVTGIDRYRYTIKVTAPDDTCNYKEVDVTVKTLISDTSSIDPGITLINKHAFGELDRSSSKTETFEIVLNGRNVAGAGASISNINGKYSLPENCIIIDYAELIGLGSSD